ncbi:hypothetical protein CGZ75_17055 [Paenibacillus herberti]|uniref:Uncharacterized protein n=1 Tax=Paenibacillus herberti TaxID=1619309 RepID=A0A229NXW1_9BACL|nr:hypothetical protein CGZ75_17055 [Paenibacillus herberti]
MPSSLCLAMTIKAFKMQYIVYIAQRTNYTIFNLLTVGLNLMGGGSTQIWFKNKRTSTEERANA